MRLRSMILGGVLFLLRSVVASAGPNPPPSIASTPSGPRPAAIAAKVPTPTASPAPVAPAPPSDTAPSPPPLTLEEVLLRASNEHPAVLAAMSSAEAVAAFARGQGKWTNPRFQLGVGTVENNNNSNQVNQDIELFGQQYLRGSAAKSDARASAEELSAIRRDVVREAATAYYQLWVAIQDHDLQTVYVDAVRHLFTVASGRSDGKQTHEVLRAKVELSRGEADLTHTEASRHAARARLNASRGLFDDPPVRLPHTEETFDLDAPMDPYPQALPPLSELLLTSDGRPEIQQQKRLVEAALFRTRLANRNALPWFGVQGNLSKWNYNTATRGFQFTLNLPIWDWGRLKAERQQLGKNYEAAQHGLETATLRVQLQVRTAWIEWQSSLRQQEELRKSCPSFHDSVVLATKQYEEGKLSIDDTLNTFKASREALREYLLAEGALHSARIRVIWASGMTLSPSGRKIPLPPQHPVGPKR